jgi:hypothetical protein
VQTEFLQRNDTPRAQLDADLRLTFRLRGVSARPRCSTRHIRFLPLIRFLFFIVGRLFILRRFQFHQHAPLFGDHQMFHIFRKLRRVFSHVGKFAPTDSGF